MPGSTPIYALPYQLVTDSPNGATVGQDLATAVENQLSRIEAATIRIRKVAQQFVNNTVTPVSDTHLQFSAAANSYYLVHAVLLVSQNANSTTADFRYGFTLPAGASWTGGGPNPDISIGATSAGSGNWLGTLGAVGTTIVVGVDGNSPNMTEITIFATIITAATAGTVAVSWAQGTATTINTNVNASSHLLAFKV